MKNRTIYCFVILSLVIAIPQTLLAASLQATRFETKNGMTVLALEQKSFPIVTLHVLVKAGSVYDPKGKAGLAKMTASLLEQGTPNRSAMEISEHLDFIGAGLSIRTWKDYTTLQLRLLKKDIEIGFEILSDILIRPTFAAEEIERIKKQTKGSILAQKDQPRAIARIAFQERVYGRHPYRFPTIGLEATIEKITWSDLVTFHQRHYRPNHTIFAIVGDMKAEEVFSMVKKYFGGWKKGKMSLPHIDLPLPLGIRKTQRVEKDLTQATVILGHMGIARSNPDFYAVRVMNYILGGGGFSSRMMTDIRDNKGLVYSIYSHFSANQFPGTFSVSLQTKNSNAKEAIVAVLLQVQKMRDAGVTAEELEEAKAFLAGSFPLKIDTTRKVASILTTIEFHNLGLDYFESYTQQIKAVTREDVSRVALKYLFPERFALVVVGQQSEIDIDSIGMSHTP